MKEKTEESQDTKKDEALIPISEVERILERQEKEILENINIQMMQIRSAPTPSPQELKQLKQIDKTFPNRLIKMAEDEQRFRHIATYLGQSQFIILVIAGYFIAGYFGKDAPIPSGIIAAGVSYIAYVFKSKSPKPPKSDTINPE